MDYGLTRSAIPAIVPRAALKCFAPTTTPNSESVMLNQFPHDSLARDAIPAVSSAFEFMSTARAAPGRMVDGAAALTPKTRGARRGQWLCFKHRVLIPAAMTVGVGIVGITATLATLGLI